MRASLIALALAASAAATPNFVFLVAESSDGRLFTEDSIVQLPNWNKLYNNGGVSFTQTMSQAPVCCPSRASFLTGKYPHKIAHWHNGLLVGGVWNNYEGLNANMTDLFDVLAAAGYSVNITDKSDWQDGGHSEDAYLEAWTHNIPFVYNISKDGGWNQEDNVCASDGVIAAGGTNGPQGSAYKGDWDAVAESVADIKREAAAGRPFVAYQGFNIVHPPYATNEYWYKQTLSLNVTVPTFVPLNEMHPCDLQSSMLKGCTPSEANAAAFYDPTRVERIRRIYFAELLEWDAMLGRYIDAVQAARVANNTYFIVLSDHGDMQLEHTQFYKMVQYEASVHVPLMIAHPSFTRHAVTQPTQLIDIFPTMLNLAGLPAQDGVDGVDLAPFLAGNTGKDPSRPNWVISEFHGDDIAMSWYMLRTGAGFTVNGLDASELKYVVFGTGAEPGITPQLFNLTDNTDELVNLALQPDSAPLVAALDALLRTAVDYPSVTQQVAQYQQDMFKWWVSTTPDWKQQLATGRRWSSAWADAPAANLQAVETWLATSPPPILPCRNSTVWPPAA